MLRLDEAKASRTRARLPLVVAFVAALALAWAGDVRTGSYSDVGGRLATVRHMAAEGSWLPEVGYWAEDYDPAGAYHPLLYTTDRGGHWVNAPSLPLLFVDAALYRSGGAWLLALPGALGVVAAAWGARLLSRWASGGDGLVAAWLVGVASPVAFYAADVWEHAPATGLAVAAIAVLVEPGPWRRQVAAGAMAGLAVVLRPDVLVAGAGLALGLLAVPDTRRRLVRGGAARAGAAVAGAAVVGAHVLAQRLVFAGTPESADRLATVAGGVGLQVAERARDALVTAVGLWPSHEPAHLVASLLAVGAAAVLARRALAGGGPTLVEVAWCTLGALALGARVLGGWGSVPGALAACPVAVVALVGARPARERALVAGAVVGALGAWATQYVGQHEPQWGGRYLLVEVVVLVAVAGGVIERAGRDRSVAAGGRTAAQRRRAGWGAMAVALALTGVAAAYGAAWRVHRTHEMAAVHERLDAVVGADEVVVAGFAHLGRENGWWYGERRMLTVPIAGDADGALDVAAAAGATRVARVELDTRAGAASRAAAPAAPDGWAWRGQDHVNFLWLVLVVDHLALAP